MDTHITLLLHSMMRIHQVSWGQCAPTLLLYALGVIKYRLFSMHWLAHCASPQGTEGFVGEIAMISVHINFCPQEHGRVLHQYHVDS